MEYRVDELAGASDVSVDTIRYYQSRGLLAPPRRDGRLGWYGDGHRERLARIRDLQAKGLSLATISRLLDGELDAADEALVTAVSASEGPAGDELLSLDQVAERSGIPLAILRAVEREGLLVPRRAGAGVGYTAADVEAASAGLALLETGLPLADVLDLARHHHEAMRAVAGRAVELFDAHVRQPLRAAGTSEPEAAERLVAAFTALLPAATTLVAHHFRRTLITVAHERFEHVAPRLAAAARHDG